ncbi:MAG TPA: septal ring lytic transglycosylase RlpA family protein [Pseudolabrys sp.]|jgi:rare lipoprotein A (peptidoglycan hydrolase)|nr:septal ring lytic transglycosylase RlpA family protein [Pseudolabrys sp.]
MHWARKKKLKRLAKERARRLLHQTCYLAAVAGFGCLLSPLYASGTSSENTLDRVQGGQWVMASMYWEDKLDASGNKFNPIGWHAAHKTLPLGTLIRVSNPRNHRSINITINDRGPFVPGRDLDLTLGAGTLLGFQGSGLLYMEVLALPPAAKAIHRPVIENLYLAGNAAPPHTKVTLNADR